MLRFDIYQIYKESGCKFSFVPPPGWKLCACDYSDYRGGEIGCIMGCVNYSSPLKCIKGSIQNKNEFIRAVTEDLRGK